MKMNKYNLQSISDYLLYLSKKAEFIAEHDKIPDGHQNFDYEYQFGGYLPSDLCEVLTKYDLGNLLALNDALDQEYENRK